MTVVAVAVAVAVTVTVAKGHSPLTKTRRHDDRDNGDTGALERTSRNCRACWDWRTYGRSSQVTCFDVYKTLYDTVFPSLSDTVFPPVLSHLCSSLLYSSLLHSLSSNSIQGPPSLSPLLALRMYHVRV